MLIQHVIVTSSLYSRYILPQVRLSGRYILKLRQSESICGDMEQPEAFFCHFCIGILLDFHYKNITLVIVMFFMIQYAIDVFRDYFAQGFQMAPIFVVIIVGCIIQIVKVIIDLMRYKRFYIGHIFASGGFPSFHSGLASSVTMLVRLDYGFGSIFFAVAFAFSVLFAYDAMNLRYETGQHAHYINDLRLELQAILQKKEKGILKERIGHTPLEVAGGILFGSILTYVLYYIYFIG